MVSEDACGLEGCGSGLCGSIWVGGRSCEGGWGKKNSVRWEGWYGGYKRRHDGDWKLI